MFHSILRENKSSKSFNSITRIRNITRIIFLLSVHTSIIQPYESDPVDQENSKHLYRNNMQIRDILLEYLTENSTFRHLKTSYICNSSYVVLPRLLCTSRGKWNQAKQNDDEIARINVCRSSSQGFPVQIHCYEKRKASYL